MTETHASADAWSEFASATVFDSVPECRVVESGIRHITGPVSVAGPVWTARTTPGSHSIVVDAVERAPAGTILFVAGEACMTRAIWGENLTVRALARGLVGVVVDGVVRDSAQIDRRGLTVYARGTCPARPVPSALGEVGTAIICGGIPVAPGDIAVTDEDGIVVVPSAVAERGYLAARAQAEHEAARLAETIASG